MIRAHLRRFIGGGLGGSLLDVEVFRFRAPALPAQRILGGGFGRGAKPPSEWNVQRVRLACGPRAPPRSWTLLSDLRGLQRQTGISFDGFCQRDAPEETPPDR